MTAILAIIPFDDRVTDDKVVARMLSRMSGRGSARASVWREGGVVIAVGRHEWELGPGFSGPVLIVQDGDYVIAADASLYYRDDLTRKLSAKGVRPKAETASHLILAAYQAFGEKCAEMLEGDFSFVIWDRKARKLFCSRDHSGQRPLFYAEFGRTVVVASKIGAIVEHPLCRAELNVEGIALDAAALIFSGSLETCYRGVFTVAAGSSLSRTERSPLRLLSWWNPTMNERSDPSPAGEAAEELVRLLGIAVEQRADLSGPTSIWLSGGWDSTAVFAAGQQRLAHSGPQGRLRPVSISYPTEDTGRDDERIAAIAAMWKVPIKWINITDVELFDSSAQRGLVRRDEPYVHLYEQLVRALARGCREVDSHVALNGHGGDFLFQVSPVYLADLLARGRLLTLARDWRAMRIHTGRARHFFEWAVQPLLSETTQTLVAQIRGRHMRGYFERALPLWMRTPFAQARNLRKRGRDGSPRAPRGSRAAYEAYWYLTQPLFPRLNSFVAEYVLEEGVETRTPMYDRRVIDFALSRPVAERNSGGEQKLLIRRAMRGLLPIEVLQPRRVKTGTVASYLSTSMKAAVKTFGATLQSPMLAQLGVVDPNALRRAANVYSRREDNGYLGEQLFNTIQTELWLQARSTQATNARNQNDQWADYVSQPSPLGNGV